MTFCIAIGVRDGVVAIADSASVEGGKRRSTRKLTFHTVAPGREMFLMTSGERTMRDRPLALFEDEIRERDTTYQRIHKAVDAFGARVRQVTGDVRASGGPDDGLSFQALLGGRLDEDDEPAAFLMENDGLWSEVSEDMPYEIIGRSRFATALLDQVLTFHTPLDDALKIGCLAADATARVSTDVGYPLDVAMLPRRSSAFLQRRLERSDLVPLVAMWEDKIRATIGELPSPWPAALGFEERRLIV